jgi:hypothetical protein
MPTPKSHTMTLRALSPSLIEKISRKDCLDSAKICAEDLRKSAGKCSCNGNLLATQKVLPPWTPRTRRGGRDDRICVRVCYFSSLATIFPQAQIHLKNTAIRRGLCGFLSRRCGIAVNGLRIRKGATKNKSP